MSDASDYSVMQSHSIIIIWSCVYANPCKFLFQISTNVKLTMEDAAKYVSTILDHLNASVNLDMFLVLMGKRVMVCVHVE